MSTFPPHAPQGWSLVEAGVDGASYRHNFADYSVIMSKGEEADGRVWIHFSLAHPHRLPAWAELVRFKEAFLGEESRAIQVLPPRSEWYNAPPYCLHLWVCETEDVIPDFRKDGKL